MSYDWRNPVASSGGGGGFPSDAFYKSPSPAADSSTTPSDTNSAQVYGLGSLYPTLSEDPLGTGDPTFDIDDFFKKDPGIEDSTNIDQRDVSSSISPPPLEGPPDVSYAASPALFPLDAKMPISSARPIQIPTSSAFAYNDAFATSTASLRDLEPYADYHALSQSSDEFDTTQSFMGRPNSFPKSPYDEATEYHKPSASVRTKNVKPNKVVHPSFSKANTVVKRSKNKTDGRQNCWESPLCPAPKNMPNGYHPDPSSCGGECGPNLFAPSPSDGEEGSDEDNVGIVQIKTRPGLKSRTASSQSIPEPINRQPARINTTKLRNRTDSVSTPASPDEKPRGARPPRKPHTEVEKNYRNNLNNGFENLRSVLPSLRRNPCTADIESLGDPKASKAMILATAKTYIENMEKSVESVEKEKERLEEQVQYLRDQLNQMRMQPPISVPDCNTCPVLGAYVNVNNRQVMGP